MQIQEWVWSEIGSWIQIETSLQISHSAVHLLNLVLKSQHIFPANQSAGHLFDNLIVPYLWSPALNWQNCESSAEWLLQHSFSRRPRRAKICDTLSQLSFDNWIRCMISRSIVCIVLVCPNISIYIIQSYCILWYRQLSLCAFTHIHQVISKCIRLWCIVRRERERESKGENYKCPLTVRTALRSIARELAEI